MQINISSGKHRKSSAARVAASRTAVSAAFAMAALVTVAATPAGANTEPADTRPGVSSAQPGAVDAPCFGTLADKIFAVLSGGACG